MEGVFREIAKQENHHDNSGYQLALIFLKSFVELGSDESDVVTIVFCFLLQNYHDYCLLTICNMRLTPEIMNESADGHIFDQSKMKM